MKEIDPNLPFVICTHCVRAYDVDWSDNSTRNTSVIWKSEDKNGDIVDVRIESECPYCFEYSYYNMNKDFYYTDTDTIEEKKIKINETENDHLRRKINDLTDKITLLERDLDKANKDRTRLRKENKKLADMIHISQSKEETYRPKGKNPLAA